MNTEQAKENVFMHSPIAEDTKLTNHLVARIYSIDALRTFHFVNKT